jgi:membrane-associated protease RseP (regulator of RpoE activity)
MNILSGILALYLGKKIYNFNIIYFGILSIALGISNLLPLAPCLDGGYLVYLPLAVKIWGKEKGYIYFSTACRISFIILMTLNILCLPYLFHLIRKGVL